MSAPLSTISAEERIASKIDRGLTEALTVSDSVGGLAFSNVAQVMEFAKIMAVSDVAVPKHLRRNVGACMAVTMQSVEWRMSPFAVANKSYSVNDRLAYEAQLIQAVVLQRAPIKGRVKVEYLGDGDKRRCRVWAALKDEPDEIVEYVSPEFGKITPKNSPLWKSDPDQQHFYYSVRAWCRRHFPDVLLGVYARDEIEDEPRIGPERAKDVTPPRTLSERLDAIATGTGPIIEPREPEPEPEPEALSEPETPAEPETQPAPLPDYTEAELALVEEAKHVAKAGAARLSAWLAKKKGRDLDVLNAHADLLQEIAAHADARRGE